MPYKVIFTTDRGEWHQTATRRSAPPDLDVRIFRKPSRGRLTQALTEADFWISERSGVIDAEILRTAPKLKLIQRLGSQVHDIDIKAAGAAGVRVCYLPLQGAIMTAEYIMLQILAVAKNLAQAAELLLDHQPDLKNCLETDEDTFQYNWTGLEGIQGIWQKTVGIIGFGEIGFELARRLQGWGCAVWYHKRSRLPAEVEDQLGIVYRAPERILSGADYLVNLLPYTPETSGYFDADLFSRCKPGQILVSSGSGGTVNESDLLEAFRQEKLAGAALDTYTHEPLPADSRLRDAVRSGVNLLLTPHIAAGTSDWPGDYPDRGADFRNILHYLTGEPLEYQLV